MKKDFCYICKSKIIFSNHLILVSKYEKIMPCNCKLCKECFRFNNNRSLDVIIKCFCCGKDNDTNKNSHLDNFTPIKSKQNKDSTLTNNDKYLSKVNQNINSTEDQYIPLKADNEFNFSNFKNFLRSTKKKENKGEVVKIVNNTDIKLNLKLEKVNGRINEKNPDGCGNKCL